MKDHEGLYKPNDPRLIGNNFASGCTTSGAPRTVSPTPEECIKLGKELVAWAKVDDKDNPHLRFPEFYSIEKMIPKKKWMAIIQLREFLSYYETAKCYLSKRCLNGGMEKSFGHRYIRIYDSELREEENDLLRLKAELARVQKSEDRELTIEDLRDALKDS